MEPTDWCWQHPLLRAKREEAVALHQCNGCGEWFAAAAMEGIILRGRRGEEAHIERCVKCAARLAGREIEEPSNV